MATGYLPEDMKSSDFNNTMEAFPCMFNVPFFYCPCRDRLKERKGALERQHKDDNEDFDEAKTNRNILTWIYFQLDHFDQAIEMNESLLIETGYECIVALGNCVFMDYIRNGRGSDHFQILTALKGKPSFDDKIIEAKLEQARFSMKMGNMRNQISAVNLFEDALAKTKRDDDRRRYYLGLAYRRLAVMHGLEKQSGNRLSKPVCMEKASECFMQVAGSSDLNLKAIALANLGVKNILESNGDGDAQIESALQIAPENPEVLYVCGRAMLETNTERSIELLERAAGICPERSVTHHQLGKAYHRLLRNRNGRRTQQERMHIQEKAIMHYKKAYETSEGLNVFPLVDLAKIYQGMRKMNEAKNETRTFLSFCSMNHDNLVQLFMGHIHMSHLTSESDDEPETAHFHLTMAFLVTIAVVKNTTSVDERQMLWSAFFENDQSHAGIGWKQSALKLQEFMKRNQRHYSGVFRTITTSVNNGQMNNTSFIFQEVQDLRSRQNEIALLFLELVFFCRQTDIESLRDLYLQVLTNQARFCLQHHLGVCSLFFKQAFEFSHYKQDGIPVNDVDDEISPKIDIIFLFNNDKGEENNLSPATAHGLEDAISNLFALRVAFNPLSARQGGAEGLVEFVTTHRSDLIVILLDGDGNDAMSHLEQTRPFLESRGNESDCRPQVALIQCHTQTQTQLPQQLRGFPCLTIGPDPFPNLFCIKEAQERAETRSIHTVLQSYFNGNFDNVMTLFKHLLRQL